MKGGEPVEEQSKNKKGNSKMMVPVAVAVIGLIIVGFFLLQGQNSNTQQISDTNPTSEARGVTTAMQEETGSYKDGEYEAVGEYTSPGGQEQIGVKVTLKDGVIVSSVVEPMATRPNSVRFQGIFKDNYQALVDGKNIDEVQLDKVSGSSLSPKGFNNALEQIKREART